MRSTTIREFETTADLQQGETAVARRAEKLQKKKKFFNGRTNQSGFAHKVYENRQLQQGETAAARRAEKLQKKKMFFNEWTNQGWFCTKGFNMRRQISPTPHL